MPNESPSQAEREFHEQVIVPLATGDFHSCVMILKRTERSHVTVFPCTDTNDDAIDLLLSGHIVLHEIGRLEREEPGDDGA